MDFRNLHAENVPHARQSNFARPFYNQAERGQPPHVGSENPDINDCISKLTAQSPRTRSDRLSPLSTSHRSTLERPTRPSQLNLAPYHAPVNENPDPAGLGPMTPRGKATPSSWSGHLGAGNRAGSFSRDGKPMFKKIRRNDSNRSNQPIRESETLPASDRDGTIKALSAAIAAGFSSSPTTPTWPSESKSKPSSGIRMPFPDSPTSTYTYDSSRPEDAGSGDAQDKGNVGSVKEQDSRQDMFGPQLITPVPERSVSSNSMNPLLGLGIDQNGAGFHTKGRHSTTDRNQIGEADTRLSITSLPELIRRATRLASNLDRGRTASRLGLEDILGYGNKDIHARNSTYSDVLVAFPAPGASTNTLSRQKPQDSWIGDEKGVNQTPSRRRRKKRTNRPERRCCGMSLTTFLIVMIIIVTLTAAAILVPIFLVLVPKENTNPSNLQHCSASYQCQNGGISLVDNNACSCVCVDGFTGNRCDTAADPDCVTADLQQGTLDYKNATLGHDVLSVLSQSETLFGIPLNTSILLSVFAVNNISCSGENSLVHFADGKQSRRRSMRQKRFVVFPGSEAETTLLPVSALVEDSATPRLTAVLNPRNSEVISTSSDLVPQSTTTQASSISTATATATADTTSSTPTTITTQHTQFAEVVVLYVLTQSRTPSIAVNAQQLMERYFLQGGPASGNATVDVGFGTENKITADFSKFTILLGNGTITGGSQSI